MRGSDQQSDRGIEEGFGARSVMTGRLAYIIAVVALMGVLGACSGRLFNPSASMRVEVEVYKGPLSKQLDAQLAELVGGMYEAKSSLDRYAKALAFVLYEKQVHNVAGLVSLASKLDCKADFLLLEDLGCSFLESLVNDIEEIDENITFITRNVPSFGRRAPGFQSISLAARASPDGTTPQLFDVSLGMTASEMGCRRNDESSKPTAECSAFVQWLKQIIGFAARLKFKAAYWVNAHTSVPHWSREVRIVMTNFDNLAAQYGNQLAARADAILKQLEGESRKNLPLSVYLRDSSPTDFPNLYAWNRAAGLALPEEMLLHPTTAFGTEETVDRVRIIERLFADEYWTKINTVYASGEGDVSMALIKDEIGNWNLKSFKNDPTELLKAYTELTSAAIEKATKLAAGAGTGGLPEALGLASRLTRGRIGEDSPTISGIDLESLRKRAIRDLEDLKEGAEAKEKGLLGKTPVDQAAIKQHRLEMLRESELILARYQAVIEALEEALSAGPEDQRPL